MYGYFYDDGTEFNPDLYPKPQLCLSCKKDDDSNENILCKLTRFDQLNDAEFECSAYENKYAKTF